MPTEIKLIRSQRKLLGKIHNMNTPVDVDKDNNYIYPCPVADVDKLWEQFNDLANKLKGHHET